MLFLILVLVLNVAVITLAEETVVNGDWKCEVYRGIPCAGSGNMVHRIDWKVPSINFYKNATCADVLKEKSNTFLRLQLTTYDNRTTAVIQCLDPLVPCITSFNVCLMDYKVPNITLSCRYLKDFEQAENVDSSTDSQYPKCGANAAKHVMLSIDSGYSVTKFDFNCEKVYFEQPLPETEPDWRK